MLEPELESRRQQQILCVFGPKFRSRVQHFRVQNTSPGSSDSRMPIKTFPESCITDSHYRPQNAGAPDFSLIFACSKYPLMKQATQNVFTKITSFKGTVGCPSRTKFWSLDFCFAPKLRQETHVQLFPIC